MRDSYAKAITFTDAHIRNNYVLTFITVGEEETSVISLACFFCQNVFLHLCLLYRIKVIDNNNIVIYYL